MNLTNPLLDLVKIANLYNMLWQRDPRTDYMLYKKELPFNVFFKPAS